MKTKILPFFLMHFGFLFFSFYTVLGKLASNYDFLSVKWCALYCSLIFLLGVYAILWQQVLKHINLSIAASNKAITIVWAMLWSVFLFGEKIELKQIIGALIILAGIIILMMAEKDKAAGKIAAEKTEAAE